MGAKEKAEEIFDKMYNSEYCGISHFPNKNYCDCSIINKHQAKQCAIITVDEIIKLGSLTDENWLNVPDDYRISYWQEVKQEIINL